MTAFPAAAFQGHPALALLIFLLWLLIMLVIISACGGGPRSRK